MIQITNIRLAFLMILAIGSGFVIDAKNNAARSSKGNLTMRTKEYVPDALAASDWSSIRTAYEAGRHTAFPVDGGYRFLNPGQQWNTQFDGRGFVTNPDCGGWSWGLELQSYGIDGHEAPILNTSNVSAEGQRVLYKWDSNLTEWYKNDGRGLEHGYTVQARPANTKGTLVFNLAIRGSLQPRVQTNGRDVRFVDSSNASVLNYSGLTVLDANGTSLPARFESTNNSLQLFVDDLNAHYPLTIDPIAQQAYLKASNTGSADKFGSSVAISGNTIVVGAIGEDSNATGVNGNQSDNSASSSGAAYVFVRSGATWTQQAYLKASNAQSGDEFGTSVAISGDTIVVGAISEDSNSSGVNGDQTNNLAAFAGAAYVFVRSGTTWSQQAYLKASNTSSSDNFGTSVAVSGETVIVGAPGEASGATGVNGNQNDTSKNLSGAAYVYVRNGSNWSQSTYLKASNTGGLDLFGEHVAISGDTIVVGARFEDSNSVGVNGAENNDLATSAGAAYVFVRNAGTWSQQAYLKASNAEANDQFAASVALSGDTIVVGAVLEKSNASGVNGNEANNSIGGAGAAYVFVRNGSTWTQQAYLKASNPGPDEFGYAVAVSANIIVVTAYEEESSATGVDGNQASNASVESGAAYVFVRNVTTWSQLAYVKASNTDTFDEFGSAVALSGDTVVIGAHFEDSNANTVGGNQSDNSALDAGAAYVFDLDTNPGTSSYGTGTPGCTGTETLDVTHAPMINSPHFAITCSNAPPLSLGLGLVTDSQDLIGTDAFGIGVLIHSDFVFATEVIALDFFSDNTGYSETVGATIPNNPLVVGKTYYACALWAWPTSTCVLPGFNPYNLSTSRGLAITILVP